MDINFVLKGHLQVGIMGSASDPETEIPGRTKYI